MPKVEVEEIVRPEDARKMVTPNPLHYPGTSEALTFEPIEKLGKRQMAVYCRPDGSLTTPLPADPQSLAYYIGKVLKPVSPVRPEPPIAILKQEPSVAVGTVQQPSEVETPIVREISGKFYRCFIGTCKFSTESRRRMANHIENHQQRRKAKT